MSDKPLLVIENLKASYPGPEGPLPTLHDVSLRLDKGQSLGVIGETGSGKTTLARCLLGLLSPGYVQGSIRLAGMELVDLTEDDWRQVRWQRIAMAFQGVGGGFNPVHSIGQQIVEPIRIHLGLSSKQATEKAQ